MNRATIIATIDRFIERATAGELHAIDFNDRSREEAIHEGGEGGRGAIGA